MSQRDKRNWPRWEANKYNRSKRRWKFSKTMNTTSCRSRTEWKSKRKRNSKTLQKCLRTLCQGRTRGCLKSSRQAGRKTKCKTRGWAREQKTNDIFIINYRSARSLVTPIVSASWNPEYLSINWACSTDHSSSYGLTTCHIWSCTA